MTESMAGQLVFKGLYIRLTAERSVLLIIERVCVSSDHYIEGVSRLCSL